MRISLGKMCQIFFGVFAVLLTANALAQGRIYSIPFEVETYLPVTRATIEREAWEQLDFQNDSQFQSFVGLLNRERTRKFNESRVRYLVKCGSHKYFIDADGIVVGYGENPMSIDKFQFEKLLQLLRSNGKIEIGQGA